MIQSIFYFLIGLLIMVKSEMQFMPNLPVGEYRLIFDAIYPCHPSKDLPLQYNLFFSKKTSKITEIKGNLTMKIPFDDNATIEANLASWSLTGGWKENSYVYINSHACSSLKSIAGKSWYTCLKAFNVSTMNCPLPKGTYTSPGIDVNSLIDHNFPKVYFYGKYKGILRLKDKEKQLLACVALEMNLVRPWEVPKS